MEKRLFRSRENRVFAGICGGIGEYMNIDPVIIRLLWVLVIFLGGAGILAYIVAIFIIPNRPAYSDVSRYGGGEGNRYGAAENFNREDNFGQEGARSSENSYSPEYKTSNQAVRTLIIIILIVIGVSVAAKILFGILGFTFFTHSIASPVMTMTF